MKYLFSILLLILFASCAKENSDSFYQYPNSILKDTVWTQQVSPSAPINQLMESHQFAPVVDSFAAAVGATIRASEFLQVSIPANSCRFVNGLLATGIIKVEVFHLRRKGDFVRFRRPTTSYGRLLKTGGAFFIRAFKEGQELVLDANSSVKLKFTDPLPTSDMKVFYGLETPAGSLPAGTNPNFTWIPATDSSRIAIFQQVDSGGVITRGYELFSKKLRWVNADYFSDTLQVQRTRLDVLLPLNFTNQNTSVFAVFNTEKIVVQLNPDAPSRSFNTFNIPVGKNVTIISLSKIGDALFMTAKPVITQFNHTESLQPEKRTQAQINTLLDNL